MFNMMDPNGNGYVEQPEFEKYLVEHGINIDKDSMNRSARDGQERRRVSR